MASQWGPSLHVWPLQAPVGASAWSWPQSSQQSSLFHSCASLLCCSLRIPTLPAKLLPICVTAEWRQTGSNLSGFSNTRKRDAFPERRLWKTGRCLVIYKLSLVSLHPRTDQLLHFYFSFSYQHVTQDMSAAAAAAAAAAARCAARRDAALALSVFSSCDKIPVSELLNVLQLIMPRNENQKRLCFVDPSCCSSEDGAWKGLQSEKDSIWTGLCKEGILNRGNASYPLVHLGAVCRLGCRSIPNDSLRGHGSREEGGPVRSPQWERGER